MNNKGIQEILKSEEGVFILKKKSELSFWRFFLDSFFLTNFFMNLLFDEKNDYLIITSKRLLIGKENKLIKNISLKEYKVEFNAIVPEIRYYNDKENRKIRLTFLMITYEETQEIKNKFSLIEKRTR